MAVNVSDVSQKIAKNYGKERRKMFFMKRILPVRQEKEMEIIKAKVEKQCEKIENQKVIIQYLAAMTDVYIPEEEEEEEEDVQNFIKNEENV